MQGDSKVIDHLNKLLSGELTAIDIYFIQARMCRDWGLKGLEAHFTHEEEEEKMHASMLIERILFLEGIPNLSARDAFTPGKDVPEMFKLDLDYEYLVAKNLKEAINYCESINDYVTREMLEKLLDDTEEDHIDWLETNIGLIEKVGIQNYLQTKMQEDVAA